MLKNRLTREKSTIMENRNIDNEDDNLSFKNEEINDLVKQAIRPTQEIPFDSKSNSGTKGLSESGRRETRDIPMPSFDGISTSSGHKIQLEIGGSQYSQCLECEYQTKHVSNLNAHIKQVHNKIKAYNCEHCSYATTHKTRLSNHITMKHGTNE
jgi:hypothetical protein